MSAVANAPAREIEELETQLDGALARLARLESANEEYVPAHIVDRLHAGEVPLRVWREYRQQTLATLALDSGVSESVIGAIEAGEVDPALTVAARLAQSLQVDVALLVPWSQE